MTETSEVFPVDQDQDYVVTAPRAVGERVLSRLAGVSRRGYMWAFDGLTDRWDHVLVGHTDTIEYSSDGTPVSRSLGMDVPPRLLTPPSDQASFYITHPSAILDPMSAVNGFGARGPLLNQVPATKEIEACIKLGLRGYADTRIVTALGVTVMEVGDFDRNAGTVSLPRISIEAAAIDAMMHEKGLVEATPATVSTLDEHFGDVVHVSFYEL